MSESSTFDCYLCGSHNEPNASFCQRCNGQLLHIPSNEPESNESAAPLQPPPIPSTDKSSDSADSDKDNSLPKSFKSRRGRTVNLEDQRLSDALGLTEDVPANVPDGDSGADNGLFAETVVTSIPRATQSSDIPLLGTRAGVVPQSAMDSRESGPKTYVLLALLVIFTGWFGYNTITRSPLTQPDSIAFVSTTASPNTTTTSTEAPRRQWRLNEVQGQYNFVFATVEFYSCVADQAPTLIGEATNGVIVNSHNVLVASAPLGADVAVIRNRRGQSRGALIDRTADGLTVVTSTRQSTRNLLLGSELSDPAAFYVGYDPVTNITTTVEETNPAVPSEVLVTAFGDAHSVRIDGNTYPAEALSALDILYEVDPNIEAAAKPDECTSVQNLRRVQQTTEVVESDTTNPTNPGGAEGVNPDEE